MKQPRIKARAVMGVVGIVCLATIASLMVLNEYPCRELSPFVAAISGIAGYAIQKQRGKN